jgi:pyruvate dehydrogenase E2 component (dihydrolipoamide acetyltransferase)
MATEIKMPQLSDTMSSGKIVVWKKKEGDQVARGEALAEVETDKANLEIECFHPGVLLKIMIPEGDVAEVGQVIAVMGQAGEAVSTASATTAAKPEVKAEVAASPAPQSAVVNANSTPSVQTHSASSDSRIIASPLAKKVAKESNLDLGSVTGSGPGGRIVRKDVDAALSTSDSRPSSDSKNNSVIRATPEGSPATADAVAKSSGTLKPFSRMRETIARRMQESVNTNPHFFVTVSINMDAASKFREILKEKPEYKGISVNHLVIKACAYALRLEPSVNCSVKDGQLYQPDSINIGIVTALPDGLLIPVVKDADKLSLRDIVFESKAGVERAKAGRPSSSDLSGGTFSISNMGMLDVENFTAIINPGQGAILAVSATKEVPSVEAGQIRITKQMKVTLSSDHRIIDGLMVANFLKHLKQALECPALLTLD